MHESPRPSTDYHQSVLEDENTRRLLRIFIGLILGGSLLYFIAAAFSSEQAGLRSAGIYLANVCALLALAQLRAGRTGRAVSLLIWGSWAALLIQVGISNGLMSRSLMAVPILIVLAGWLLSAREALLFYVATILSGMLLALGTQAGLLPLRSSSAPPLLVWLAFSIYVILAAAVAYHIFRGFRLRHEDLAERKAELDLLMHNVPSMIFHGDRDKRCLYANRAYVEFYDPRSRNPVGKTVSEIVGEEAISWLRAGETGSLANALVGHYPELAAFGYSPREPGIVHRLDTDTSGLVVVGRTADAFEELRASLKAEALKKTYLVVVKEEGLPDEGTIEFPLTNHPKDQRRVYACVHPRDVIRYAPRPASTQYRVVERKEAWALVEAEAPKALRHQIRAHFAALGHPLAGDELYGGAPIRSLGRHALHASRVRYGGGACVDPFDVSSPLPAALANLMG